MKYIVQKNVSLHIVLSISYGCLEHRCGLFTNLTIINQKHEGGKNVY